MFKHLLVPLDGSHLAEAVLPAAASLAGRLGARVTLLHVLEHGAPETVHGERHLARSEDAQAYLDGVARRLAGQGITAERVVDREQDDVVRTIAARAAAQGADLIVICTHGHGGLRDLLFGSVAQQVLSGGTIPVLLIQPAAAEQPPFACRRVLVPLDGTGASETALPVATAIGRAYGGELLLLHVVPTLMTMPGDRAAAAQLMPTAAAAMLDAEADRAARYLEALRGRVVTGGVSARALVERGEPVQALLAAAAEHHADLVVMATHARSGMAAVWTGSVAARFLPHHPAPVLLVRAPTGE
jgi:nucleotide-binding universal stress UspA family protein